MAANEIVAGKETVVRRKGADWSFHLPDRHELILGTIVVDGVETWIVSLRTPSEGSTFWLGHQEDTDDEVVVELGSEMATSNTGSGPMPEAQPRGYRLPEIQEELDRLLSRWNAAGLNEAEFHAYAPGSTHEAKLHSIRARLREVGG